MAFAFSTVVLYSCVWINLDNTTEAEVTANWIYKVFDVRLFCALVELLDEVGHVNEQTSNRMCAFVTT